MNNNPNALPSYNIADVDTEIGFYKTLFHLHDKGAMSCLPAIVEKYDRATHIAEVKPLVKSTMRLEDEEVPFDRPTYRVPVQQMCHGGFNIDAPLFVGDTGLLFAIDREWITARKRNSAALKEPQDPKKSEENPNKGAVVPDSYGLASFEYGFFLPCSWAKTDLKDEDGFVVRLPVKDGEVIIRIDKDGTTTFSGDVVFDKSVTFKDKIYGTEGEFSGLIKANDFKTDDCEILELDVVTDAKTEDGVTTLKIGKFKILRSQILCEAKEVEVYGGGEIGPEGPQGEQGPQGPRGEQGEQGEQGVGIEDILSDALPEEGYTSTNVTVGLTDGSDKTFVVVAKNGAKGEQGEQGEQGPQGGQGEQGVGIESITSDAVAGSDTTSTTVTVTLSNGVRKQFPVIAKNGDDADLSNIKKGDGILVSLNAGIITISIDSSRLKNLNFAGYLLGQIFATQDVNIEQKVIKSGSGIAVTEADNVITIAAEGTTPVSSYSGTRYVLADAGYDQSSHYLIKRFYEETWSNGVLVSSVLQGWENYSQAVEETV